MLAMLLAMVMVLGMIPLSALATPDPTNQILTNGNVQYFGETGNTATQNEAWVEMSKIATQINENEFDITLSVKTRVEVKEWEVPEDAVTAIVFDLSGSMNECAYCNSSDNSGDGTVYYHVANCSGGGTQGAIVKSASPELSRLYVARAALNTFLTGYAASGIENGAATAQRWISLATFSTDAKARKLNGEYWINLTDLTGGKTVESNIAVVMNALGTTASGSTNVEGGLQVAYNLYKYNDTLVSSVINRNVILFTDGEANHSSNARTSESVDEIKGTNTAGNGFTHTTRAVNMATNIKNDINPVIYTVCYTVQNNTATTAMQNMSSGAGCYFTPVNSDDLSIVFETISNAIRTRAEVWTIVDPMNTNIVYDKANSPTGAEISFNDDNNTLSIDLKKVPRWDILGGGWFGYSYTYRVKLDTIGAKDALDSIATNKTTTLNYLVTNLDVLTPEELAKAEIVNFNVPTVKGFKGNIEFDKVGADGNPLNGCGFTLTSADGRYTDTAESVGGVVTFENIPSGHDYTIVETAVGTENGKFDINPTPILVTVAYGTATITSGLNDDRQFVNPYDAGSLKITKLDGFVTGTPGYQAIEAGKTFGITVTFTSDDAAYLAAIIAPAGFVEDDDDYSDEERVFTGSIGVGETVIFSNIAVSVEYVVEEEAITGYEVSYRNKSGEIANKDEVAVTITNNKKNGPSFEVDKSISRKKTGGYEVGDGIVFIITVENTGGYPIKQVNLLDQINGNGTGLDIKIIDAAGDEQEWTTAPDITIPVGGSQEFVVNYTVKGNEGANAFNKITATVVYDDGNDTESDPQTDTEDFKVLLPNVTIVKTRGTVGQNLDLTHTAAYTIEVENTGNATAYGVIVSDALTNDTLTDIPGSGMTIGTITVTGGTSDGTYTDFTDILAFNLAAGQKVTIAYEVTFASNVWNAEDMLAAGELAQLTAWRDAKAAFETAKKAYDDAVALYDAAVATAASAADSTDMDDAFAAIAKLLADYEAAQAAFDAMYAEIARFEQDMQDYIDSLGTGAELPMPVDTAYNFASSTDIANAEYDRDMAYAAYAAAVDAYNHEADLYNASLFVDRDDFDLDNLKAAYDAADAAFAALGDLSFDVGNLPGDHDYSNTATVTYKYTANGTPKEGTPSKAEDVNIEPSIIPALIIDKLVSVDGGKNWSRIASFDKAEDCNAMFKMTIRNIGLATISDIVVTDTFDNAPAEDFNLNGFNGTLPAGEKVEFTWSAKVDNETYNPVIHTNVFTVSYSVGPDDSSTEMVKEATAIVIVPARKYADVSINKEVWDDAKYDWVKYSNVVNDDAVDFEFRFTLTNSGTADAEVTLSDKYTYMVFDKTESKYVALGSPVDLDLGTTTTTTTVDVPAGAGVKDGIDPVYVYATLKVEPGEYVVNKVTAEYTGKDDEKTSDDSEAIVSVTPTPKAYLSVEKKIGVNLGTNNEDWVNSISITSNSAQRLVFKITIKNAGSVAGAVILKDALPTVSGGSLYEDDMVTSLNSTTEYVLVDAFSSVVYYYIVDGARAGTHTNVATIEPFIDIGDGEAPKDVVIVVPEDSATATISTRVIPDGPNPPPPTQEEEETIITIDPTPQGEFESEEEFVDETPQGEFEEEEEFIDETPLGALETGDNNLLALYAALLLVSILGIAGIWFTSKKKSNVK